MSRIVQYPVIKDTCLPLPGRIGMHKEVWASDTAMQGRMSADKCEYAVTQPTPHHYGPMLGVNIQIKEATLGLCMLQIIIIFIGPTINHSLGLRYVRVQAETLTGLVLVPGSWGGVRRPISSSFFWTIRGDWTAQALERRKKRRDPCCAAEDHCSRCSFMSTIRQRLLCSSPRRLCMRLTN